MLAVSDWILYEMDRMKIRPGKNSSQHHEFAITRFDIVLLYCVHVVVEVRLIFCMQLVSVHSLYTAD